jgi:hypothetical protein
MVRIDQWAADDTERGKPFGLTKRWSELTSEQMTIRREANLRQRKGTTVIRVRLWKKAEKLDLFISLTFWFNQTMVRIDHWADDDTERGEPEEQRERCEKWERRRWNAGRNRPEAKERNNSDPSETLKESWEIGWRKEKQSYDVLNYIHPIPAD